MARHEAERELVGFAFKLAKRAGPKPRLFPDRFLTARTLAILEGRQGPHPMAAFRFDA